MGRMPRHVGFRHRTQQLKRKVTVLKEQAKKLRDRVDKIAALSREKQCAVVDRSMCNGCGMCEQVCPADAVKVTYVAHVNSERCTGCGICVKNCSQNAIRLRRT